MQRSDETIFSRRDWKFEPVEERLALSIQPVAEFWIDESRLDWDQYAGPVVPLGAEASGWSDVTAARDQFGLRGERQTVAVIDSGIAYDHIALGGGLGKAYRVVGGWDFAENDANPYDDGPAGYHGTHVAGIVAARDERHAGVAPAVDVVALRVLDDQGQSQLAWVESALKWVHQNRAAFQNPITTVNLSLGTDWNASSLPQWATLEEELKQLAADGIFVSVAAGNSFLVYGAAGLSYPAVSQYVTPVASVDASGSLSRFSQRSDRVLAAPGERITSTLPDHFYGGDGVKNDWGATSGTSMAAPYVAGAAVLVREAMQNLGFTHVTQSTIYDRLRTTADLVFDSATSASYRRVNLTRAIESLVGADDFGSTATGATTIGALAGALNVSGTIGRLSDHDFFRFTAARTGTATLTLSSPARLAAAWQATIGVGQISGNRLTMQVAAGQSYVVGVAGGGASIGKYSVDLRLTPTSSGPAGNPDGPPTSDEGDNFSPINWGAVEQLRRNGLNLRTADSWFQVTASRSGMLTVEAMLQQSRGNIDLELYDAQRRLIASSATVGNERIDASAVAGGTYFVRVRGTNGDVDLRLTNLVTFAGGSVQIAGTGTGDLFVWNATTRQITINEVQYHAAGATSIRFDGRGGHDAVTFIGGAAAESATLRPGSVELVGGGLSAQALNIESSRVLGNYADTALLFDSAGRDNLQAGLASVALSGDGFRSVAENFGQVTIRGTAGGGDFALLSGSDGNDVLTVWAGVRLLSGGGTQVRVEDFQTVRFYGGAGWDQVNFYATGKRSWLGGQASTGWVYVPSFTTEFAEVESLLAHARIKQRLSIDLVALDYVFRRIGV
jgi:subtilisin family serine protease